MFLKVMAWGAGTIVVAGALAFSEGAIHVNVQEKQPEGTHLRLFVPAALVPVGLKFVPREDLRDASAELRPWAPTIEAALDGLRDVPDGPLVEVTDPHEHVTIVKQARALIVDVNDENETVHVSVPIAVARRAVQELAEAGPAQ